MVEILSLLTNYNILGITLLELVPFILKPSQLLHVKHLKFYKTYVHDFVPLVGKRNNKIYLKLTQMSAKIMVTNPHISRKLIKNDPIPNNKNNNLK